MARSTTMRKANQQEEFSRRVLRDDERTRATSSHSSARASETQELVKQTLDDAVNLKRTFEYGEKST